MCVCVSGGGEGGGRGSGSTHLIVFWSHDDLFQPDDVFVPQLVKDLYFTVSVLCNPCS